MQAKLKRGYAAVAVMAVAVTLLIVSMTAPVVSTTADFSIYNSDWNGTSDIAVFTFRLGKFVPTFVTRSTGTDMTIAQMSLEDLNLDPLTSSLVVIGPTKKFSTAEGRIVRDFVEGGGMLLLADDFGSGNSLLENMGASTRFSNDLVLDLAFEKQPEFAVLFDITADAATVNVTTVLMNYPSSLQVNSSSTEVLARSSVGSWLDTNGNRLREWGEPRGPFPVLARESIGQGTIVLLSDPSVLINGMNGYMDNSVLATDLINYVCQDRVSVMFDESHRTFFDPVTISMIFTGDMSINAKIAIASLALVLTLWITTDLVDRTVAWIVKRARLLLKILVNLTGVRRFTRKEKPALISMTDEEMIDRLSKDHPEWRIGLVRYLVHTRSRHSKLPEKK